MRRFRVGAGLGWGLILLVCGAAPPGGDQPRDATTLPGTIPLTWTEDIASRLVAGVDRFLLREIDRSTERRARFWKRDTSTSEHYHDSIEPNRKRLAHILGVRDPRVAFDAPEFVATTTQPALIGRGAGFEAFAVRWPSFGDVHAEGLLLIPVGRAKVADVVAVPDADQTPEQIVGLAEGVSPGLAVRASAGGERMPCARADADQPQGSPRGSEQAHEPRVPLSIGIRARPASDRLRGAESAGGRRLVRQGLRG